MSLFKPKNLIAHVFVCSKCRETKGKMELDLRTYKCNLCGSPCEAVSVYKEDLDGLSSDIEFRSGSKFKCGHCGYEGPCYGVPSSHGVSAPFCRNCQMNDKLTPVEDEYPYNEDDYRKLEYTINQRREAPHAIYTCMSCFDTGFVLDSVNRKILKCEPCEMNKAHLGEI